MSSSPPYRYEPDYTTMPGEVLEEHLLARGMTKVELAIRCGRPVKTISEIIHGKAAITAETALQLGRVLGVSASLWQNLEANYRLHLAKEHEADAFEDEAAWAKKFPVRALVNGGHIEKPADDADLVEKLLAFFGVGTVAGWHASFGLRQVAFRRSAAFATSPEAVAAWIRLGEAEAAELETARYKRAAFKRLLTDIRLLTAQSFPDVEEQLIETCREVGVAVVIVPELPKTRLSGIARWLTKDKPLIQLSMRHKSSDHLWFSFFHEAGHILLHSKKTVFIDANGDDIDDAEMEANDFAASLLIPNRAYAAFIKKGAFSSAAIKAFAGRQGIGPGIVVGRLQREGHVPFSMHNKLKERLEWVTE